MSAWWLTGGPPRSRAIRQATAARLPPALSPITPIGPVAPSSAACCAAQSRAAKQSSTAAGNRCTGASR